MEIDHLLQEAERSKVKLIEATDRLRRQKLKAAIKTCDRPMVHTSVYVEDCQTEQGISINSNLTFLSAIVTDGSKKGKWQATIPVQIDGGGSSEHHQRGTGKTAQPSEN